MFKRLFEKKKGRQMPLNRLVLFLNSMVKRRAEKTAKVLSNKAQKLSDKQLLRRLYAFAMIGVLLNAIIITAAFTGHPGKVNLPTNNISKPQLKLSGHSSLKENRKQELAQVQKLENFLDSLQQTETGRQRLVLFMKDHPGLRDSLELFKSLFSMQ